MQDEGGQAAVEFALVLPILVLLVTAIVQFGLLFFHYLTLTDAVRAGARVAAVSRQASNPVSTAQSAVVTAGTDLHLSANQVAVTSDWTAGHTVTVKATYPYTLSIFGIPVTSGSLTSQTTERVE